MNIKSPNGVMCHLRALERKGKLTRTANKSRAIELTEPVSRLMGGSLPFAGTVLAGACTLLNSDSGQRFDLAELVAPNRYLLEVRDDSLLAAQIKAGDRLVVQKQNTAMSGQLVLQGVSENEPCLRYWLPEEGRIRLQPIDPSQASMLVEHTHIRGVVVGVIRLLETPPPTATNATHPGDSLR